MIRINDPYVTEAAVEKVTETVISGQLVAGKNVAELERQMTTLTGCKYAIGISNATVGLELILRSINAPLGSEVITSPFTFHSAITAILRAGYIPVFADICDDYNIGPDSAQSLITDNTSAIIATHMFGYPATLNRLYKICEDNGIDLIEDAAQAIGAKYRSVHVGTMGAASIFSFYASKNIGCGEGGVIVTNDVIIAEYAAMLREGCIGVMHKLDSEKFVVGSNLRMSEISAPLATEGLKDIYNVVATRRRNAAALAKYLGISHVHLNETDRLSSWNSFPILHEDRDGLIKFLAKNDIEAKPYYKYLINYDPIYQKFNSWQETPKALEISKKIVSLPVHHNLNDIHMQLIAEKVKEYESTAR